MKAGGPPIYVSAPTLGPTNAPLFTKPYFFAAARYAAQRFFVAAAIAALPAALSFRFGFGAGAVLGVASRLAKRAAQI